MTTLDEIRSIADLSRVHARLRPDAPAFEFEGRRTSWAQFDHEVSRLANALIATGAQPGQHVAYLGKNTDRCCALLCATGKSRTIFTPLNWRLAGPELVQILADCGARILLVGREFLDMVDQLRPEVRAVQHFIAVEDLDAPRLGWIAYSDWLAAQSDTDPGGEPGLDEAAIQLYTSGTTGLPKGVMLSTRAYIMNRRLQGERGLAWACWDADDVSLLAMPNFHIGGTGQALLALYYGAKSIVLREFNPAIAFETLVKGGVTRAFLVPAAILMLLQQPGARDADYSSLRYINYGASPIPLDLLRQAMQVYRCHFTQAYGMTETFGTIVALPPDEHDPNGGEHMRSAGKPLPGVEVAIVNERGEHLPPRQVGEIITRSASNMLGYWNQPAATAATLQADGWLRTGDAGYFDEAGYLYVHDRVKDMIISGGENVYPAEVESAIFGHSAVADVAVIGVPDTRWGEAVKAMVVLKPGAEATEKDIIGFARTRIAGYKCPKSVDFIAVMPRNPSGKILRRELRKPFWEGRERQVN